MSLVEFASGVAKRFLNEQRIQVLRGVYLKGRAHMAPLMCRLYGTFDCQDLRRHLEERVGTDYQVLMVHSSVNHMTPMFTGTPLELVRMLIEFCGRDRTLVMPGFYFGEGNEGAFKTFVRNPRFDLRRTPSQMGLATELFRRTPGVLYSRHPVYRFLALGPHAKELTEGHEHAQSPAGKGSPFETMTRLNTCIIGLGKPVHVLTHTHHTEELMGDEFPVPSRPGTPLSMTLIDREGEIPFVLRGRSVDGRYDNWKVRKLMAPGTLHEWQFHHVPMFATRAAEVTRQLVAAARRGQTLYDPL